MEELTHIEKVKATFLEMGAEFIETKNTIRGVDLIELNTSGAIEKDGIDLNMGYSGFECCMYFDLNGKFVGMGGWE